MIFRQLFDHQSSTYTYIIADPDTREAAIIDPVIGQHDRDVEIVQQMGLKILYLIETHIHADHITGSSRLKKSLGGEIVAGETTGLRCADLLLADEQTLQVGGLELKARLTPGHTDGCTCWVMKDRVFTGDTLLIRGCGRTDFQQGDAKKLFLSVREKLFQLSDSTLVFPGHDYKGRTCSTIGEEKRFNPRLNLKVSESEFVEIMDNLNLSQPLLIEKAVPANMRCGNIEVI